MKNVFLILLGLILSIESFAASGSGSVSLVQNLCGMPLDGSKTSNQAGYIPLNTTNDYVVLVAGSPTAGSSAGHLYPFYSGSSPIAGAQTIYRVPSNKTFWTIAVNIYANSATDSLAVAYGTAPLTSADDSAEPAGATYYSGTSTLYNLIAVSAGWNNYQIPFSFPPNSYPYIKVGQASQVYSIIMCGKLY